MSQPELKPSTPFTPPLPKYQGRAADRKALVDMQRTMFALTQDPSVAPHIRAACARAWKDLQEQKRIMDGKPLPGMLRPSESNPSAIKGRRQNVPTTLPLPTVDTGQELPTAARQQLPSSITEAEG